MGSNMFEYYYANQLMKGGGDVFQGSVYQRGYGSRRIHDGFGTGGLFKTLFRVARPLTKEVAKTLRKEAMSSGVRLLGDLAAGHNPKTALKSRLREVGKNMLHQSMRKVTKTMGGRVSSKPIKRRAAITSTLVAKRPRKHQHREKDIFD